MPKNYGTALKGGNYDEGNARRKIEKNTRNLTEDLFTVVKHQAADPGCSEDKCQKKSN